VPQFVLIPFRRVPALADLTEAFQAHLEVLRRPYPSYRSIVRPILLEELATAVASKNEEALASVTEKLRLTGINLVVDQAIAKIRYQELVSARAKVKDATEAAKAWLAEQKSSQDTPEMVIARVNIIAATQLLNDTQDLEEYRRTSTTRTPAGASAELRKEYAEEVSGGRTSKPFLYTNAYMNHGGYGFGGYGGYGGYGSPTAR
jgi:hypothetical protein